MFDVAGGQRIKVTGVAGGLAHPWSLAFPDARTMLVTERPGRLRVIRDGVLLPQPAWQAPPPPGKDTDGLHFIALHPNFAQNQWVYMSHPKYGEKGSTLAISRGEFDGTTLTNVSEIFVADAWETSGNMAGRIYFAPDGMLYVTVGDRDRLCCVGTEDNSLRMKAQDLSNHVGKTLRLRDDGTVPPDNPFVGRAGAKPEIFTYGHRNGYGLAFNPDTKSVWQAEIGPLGGDEVNVLRAGPQLRLAGGVDGAQLHRHAGLGPAVVRARAWTTRGCSGCPRSARRACCSTTATASRAGRAACSSGALTTRSLIRVSFNQPSQAERREVLLGPLNTRIRDVQLGPDGNLYVVTEQASGGTATDGTVLRIEPVQ